MHFFCLINGCYAFLLFNQWLLFISFVADISRTRRFQRFKFCQVYTTSSPRPYVSPFSSGETYGRGDEVEVYIGIIYSQHLIIRTFANSNGFLIPFLLFPFKIHPIIRTFAISNKFSGPVGVRINGCLLYVLLLTYLKFGQKVVMCL